jgi:N-acetylneuraminate epimerase
MEGPLALGRWKSQPQKANSTPVSKLWHSMRASFGWSRTLLSALLLVSALSACSTHNTSHSLSWSQLSPLPDAHGVAAPFVGVSGGALLVAGGANFPDRMPWDGGRKVWHDTVYALTSTNARWQPVGKLPRPLAYGVSITAEDGVVCIGGSDSDRHYQDVLLLTYTNGLLAVHALPALPSPLANAAGARVGSAIYVAGGSDQPGEQSALNQCYALDLAQKSSAWAAVEPCPGKPRILPVAAALRGSFYLVGGAALERTNGRVARVYLRDAWRYRPGKGWQRLADLPKPCVAGPTPAPSLDNTFLLLGGDDGSRVGFQPLDQHPGFPRTILAYDANTETWHELGEVPVSRVAVPTAFWRDCFVIPSGEERPGVRSPQVWSLTVATCAGRR